MPLDDASWDSAQPLVADAAARHALRPVRRAAEAGPALPPCDAWEASDAGGNFVRGLAWALALSIPCWAALATLVRAIW
jgi:hypothetical protein